MEGGGLAYSMSGLVVGGHERQELNTLYTVQL